MKNVSSDKEKYVFIQFENTQFYKLNVHPNLFVLIKKPSVLTHCINAVEENNFHKKLLWIPVHSTDHPLIVLSICKEPVK